MAQCLLRCANALTKAIYLLLRCKPCIGFLAAIRQPTSCIMLLHLLFIPYAAGAAILRYQAIRVNGASVMEPVAQ